MILYWLRIENGTPKPNINAKKLSPIIETLMHYDIEVEHTLLDVESSELKPGYLLIEIALTGVDDHDLIVSALTDEVLSCMRRNGIKMLVWHPEEIDEYYVNIDLSTRLGDIDKVFVGGDFFRYNSDSMAEIFSLQLSFPIFGLNMQKINEKDVCSDLVPMPTKKFICTNNIIRNGKIYILSGIWGRGLLDEGYVSIVNSPNRHRHHPATADQFDKTTYFTAEEKSVRLRQIDSFAKKYVGDGGEPDIKLTLDKGPINFDPWTYYYNYDAKPMSELAKYYQSVYFSIVNDTIFTDDNSLSITEKLYIPIMFKTPFIATGNRFMLSFLRSQGFVTFPELFDESYDTIIDPIERSEFILDEIERVCNLDDSELDSIMDTIKWKLEYNHNLLLTHFSWKPKFNMLFDKLQCYLENNNDTI